MAAHVLLALAGSLLALVVAPLGFVLVLVAATSLYLDQNTRLYLIRRLFFRRASQNVVSPGPNPAAPARLILSAHYDAAKTGLDLRPPLDPRRQAHSPRPPGCCSARSG